MSCDLEAKLHPWRLLTLKFTAVGSGGKNHTAVITDEGHSYTFGSNLHVRTR